MRKLMFWLLMLCMTLPGMAEADQTKRIPLKNIQKLELISVTPELNPNNILKPDESKTFHGFPVLSRRVIEDRSAIKEIIEGLNSGLRPHLLNQCLFSPRHALKVFYKDSQIDYLICYQCGDVEKFNARDDKNPEMLSTDKSSKVVLDHYLTETKMR